MIFKKNDEYYTPSYIVKPLTKIIPKEYIIWLPFDTQESNYYKVLSKNNKCICTGNNDFFTIKPNFKFDIIISNIPFSKKKPILEKIKKNNWKYCILVSIMAFANKGFNKCLLEESWNIIIFENRIKFKEGGLPSFNSMYITNDLISKNIMIPIETKEMIIDTPKKQGLPTIFDFI